MELRLKPIYINELRVLRDGKTWNIKGYLHSIKSLTPLIGFIKAIHEGSSIYVKGKVETIINLRCDNCLKLFNQKIRFEEDEVILISKKESNISSSKNPIDPLIECIKPNESFDPEKWCFDQVNLQISPFNKCNSKCNFIPSNTLINSEAKNNVIDPRFEKLKNLL